MRLLLALLALVGLLLSPAAASAGAAACAHHMGEAQAMVMDGAMPGAAMAQADTGAAGDHGCCDPAGDNPAQHDSKACAQACAQMCVTTAAIAEPGPAPARRIGHLVLEAATPKTYRAHAPPGLERPPRPFA
jgi:hypothetical protein